MPSIMNPQQGRVVPMVARSADSGAGVLRVGRPFSAGELRSMVLDGLVVHLFGSTYLRSGSRPGQRVRAQAMADEIPTALLDRVVIGRESATWIYAGGPPPAKINLLTDHHRRTTVLRPSSGCRLHEVHLSAEETMPAASSAVTTPLRTAVDMALYAPAPDASAAVAFLASQPALECPLELVRDKLESLERVPRKRKALSLVDSLLEDRD